MAVRIVVCRGCCCGTTRKHPDTDHGRQLAMLAEAVAAIPGARLRTVGCLDLCRSSNVIAVGPAQ